MTRPGEDASRDEASDAAATLAGDLVRVESDTVSAPSDGGSSVSLGPERLRALERGATLGRYVILEQVGLGGMSIVYAAYDPELDRRVAIKVLLPARADGAAARARMQREAQAIASLSHPNVIAVHDVGIEAGRVFLAMEFVQGRDLAAWAKSTPTPAEVLRVYLQAGEGLAAAHRAGLVHRDFKPENALLGDDERVRVLDFGLVRRSDEAGASSASLEDPPAAGPAATSRLTVDGAVMGTPAYMAPEQFAGADADARSDQFSFCVALYEALYGQRPFEGDTIAALAAAVTAGTLAVPRALREAPARLYRVLGRGLARDPKDRHPDMDALLAELRAEPRSRRARGALALGIAVGVAAVGWVAYEQGAGDRSAVCSGASERRAQVWGAERVSSIRDAFMATGEPLALRTFDRITGDAGRWLDTWEGIHREACLATRVRRERSEDALDMQMACLDGRLRALESVAQSFQDATPKVVLRAVDSIAGLPDPSICADLDALEQRVRPPDDPQVRVAVRSIQEELARAKALVSLDKASEASEIVSRLRAQASELGYAPLEAEIEIAYARLRRTDNADEMVSRYERAFELSLAAADDALAAAAANEIMYILAEGRVDLDEAESWARRSQALLHRVGGEEQLELEVLSNWAMLESRRGQFVRARRMYEDAIEKASAKAASHPFLASLHANLGAVEGEMRLIESATAHTRKAVELREEVLGELHPDTLLLYMNLGSLAFMDRRFDEAVRLLELVQGRAEGTRLEATPLYGNTLAGLCRAYRRLDKLDEAIAIGTRAASWYATRFGEESWLYADALAGLGLAQLEAGQEASASDTLGRALDVFDSLPGGELKVAETVAYWAHVLGRRGAPEAGREIAQRWLDRMLERRTEACALRSVAVVLGHREIDLGDRDAARRHFELARDLHGFDHALGREAHVSLGLGWLRLGEHGSPDSAQGRAAAQELLRDAERLGDRQRIEDEVEQWLAGADEHAPGR